MIQVERDCFRATGRQNQWGSAKDAKRQGESEKERKRAGER